MENILIFIIGCAFGSFINMLTYRLPKGKRISTGRSHCDYCHKTLQIIDLIPVLSYILLSGRCRHCKKKLSYLYPVVEVVSGIGFVLIYKYQLFFPLSATFLSLIYLWLVLSFLLTIVVTDLTSMIVPDKVVIWLITLSLAYQTMFARGDLVNHLLAAVGSSLFMFFLHIITRGRGMGLGDVKFAFFMGLFLGIPSVIVAFYLSFLTGALVAVILLICGLVKFKQRIPFAPFLVLSTATTYIWEMNLLKFFLKLLF